MKASLILLKIKESIRISTNRKGSIEMNLADLVCNDLLRCASKYGKVNALIPHHPVH